MLTDPRAIEIISRARQKNVASPKRSSADFDAILADFFDTIDVSGQLLMDLGPGQYDFAERMRSRGARVHNVDHDPAVVELGRYLGFEVFDEELRRLDVRARRHRYDGIFCKFSINAFWFSDAARVRAHVERLDSLLKPDGWGWIAPWNGPGKLDESSPEAAALLQAQEDAFTSCGWRAFHLGADETKRYRIRGKIANHVLFTRHLPVPERLSEAVRPGSRG